jgi:arsenate reductase-like glutaredoxin family protein
VKDAIDETSAIQLMLDTPSIIKRPVLEIDGTRHVGFKADVYAGIFGR